MTRSLHRLCFLLAAATALAAVGGCFASGSTASKKRVVVLQIEGKKTSSVRGSIVDLVDNRYEVVPRSRYKKTAKRLKAGELDERDVKKVADELDLAAVVHGELVKKGKSKYSLRLKVRKGKTGEFIDAITVTLKNPKLSGKAKKKVRKKLLALLKDVPANRGDGSKKKEKKKAKKAKKAKKTQKAKKDKKDKKKRASRDDDRDDDRDDEADDEDDSDRRRARKKKRRRDREDKPKEEDDSYEIVVKTNGEGQAIDDEMPSSLK